MKGVGGGEGNNDAGGHAGHAGDAVRSPGGGAVAAVARQALLRLVAGDYGGAGAPDEAAAAERPHEAGAGARLVLDGAAPVAALPAHVVRLLAAAQRKRERKPVDKPERKHVDQPEHLPERKSVDHAKPTHSGPINVTE